MAGLFIKEPIIRGDLLGKWMMSNVRREIRAARLRQTIDERGNPVTIH
jgi:hypothetical protein